MVADPARREGRARWFELPAAKTKTDEARVIPIGDRLRAELSMRRHPPDGREHPADAYVFGDEAGVYFSYDRLRGLWEDAVLRRMATPVRVRGKLTAESRAAYQAVGLHLHDLRREFASRLLEASADLHDVQLFLGHANITTTSTYLRSTPVRLKRRSTSWRPPDSDIIRTKRPKRARQRRPNRTSIIALIH